jgi:hypothetical protein
MVKKSIWEPQRESQKVRNVQKTPQVRLSIGKTFDGIARFLAERAEHERAMAAIRKKY